MLDLLTDYHETTVEYEGPDDGELIRQTCLGWSMGGCDTVWADVLQRILCRNGRRLVGGCTVLELGAGCGQLGLLAANWASRVDLTDGEALTNRKSNDEDATLNLQGCDPSCRLSCVTFVYGDVDVTVRPDREGGFFGSASSGSGW